MRIVHFSDIHIGCWCRDFSALFDKRILGCLNYFLRRRAAIRYDLLPKAVAHIQRLAPDWIVFTGDLTSVGTAAEFEAGLACLRPLVRGASSRFLYVPGNHDAYVPNAACRAALERAVRQLNQDRFGREELPVEIRAGNVRLFLVDECMPTSIVRSSGAIRQDVRERLAQWLEAPREPGEMRVLAGHFPCRNRAGRPYHWRRGLAGAEVISTALDRGQLDYALCGHEHSPFLRQEPGGAVEVCAGALLVHGQLNVLDYNPESGRFSQFWVDVRGDDAAPALLPGNLAVAGVLE